MIGLLLPFLALSTTDDVTDRHEVEMTHHAGQGIPPYRAKSWIEGDDHLKWRCSMKSVSGESFEISGTFDDIIFSSDEPPRSHRAATFRSSLSELPHTSGTAGWNQSGYGAKFWFKIESAETRYKFELDNVGPGTRGIVTMHSMDVESSRYDFSWKPAAVGVCEANVVQPETEK